VQFLSAVGFIIGFGWIAMAFMSQHQGNNANYETVYGGLAGDPGIIPVIIATGFMTKRR